MMRGKPEVRRNEESRLARRLERKIKVIKEREAEVELGMTGMVCLRAEKADSTGSDVNKAGEFRVFWPGVLQGVDDNFGRSL
jgi:hypothetical protein